MNKYIKYFISIILLLFIKETSFSKKIKASDFNLFDLNKKVHRLSKIKKIVVLNFFGTWCKPCRKEIPGFVNLYRDYKDKGVEFLGILLDRDYKEKDVKKFINRYKIKYPVLINENGTARDYQIRAIPVTYIINENGYIVKKHIGYLSEKGLKKMLDKYIVIRNSRNRKKIKKRNNSNGTKQEKNK